MSPITPKLAGGGAGLPHEFPETPEAIGGNDKYILSLLNEGKVLGVVRFLGVRSRDPAEPGRGQAQAYVYDDDTTVEFRVRYNDEGTLKTGAITLA